MTMYSGKKTYYNKTYLICFLIIGVFVGFMACELLADKTIQDKNAVISTDENILNHWSEFQEKIGKNTMLISYSKAISKSGIDIFKINSTSTGKTFNVCMLTNDSSNDIISTDCDSQTLITFINNRMSLN